MARFARLRAPGALVHIISRVVNREFRIVGEAERTHYLYRLRKSLQRTDWKLLTFALMSNHIHLALMAGLAASARLMQSLHVAFASWLNKTQGRLGPVFAERHVTILSDESKAARLLAYLHNNPVRARVVNEAAHSNWTGQHAYLEPSPNNQWLDVELGLSLSGFSADPAGRLSFYDYVRSVSGQTREQLAEEGLTSSRREARRLAGAPVEISSREEGENESAVQVIALPFTPLRPRWPGDVQAALLAVEVHTGVPISRMQSVDRHRRVVAARKLALHLWSIHLGRDSASMASALGLSRPAASQLSVAFDQQMTREATNIARSLWDLCSPATDPSPLI